MQMVAFVMGLSAANARMAMAEDFVNCVNIYYYALYIYYLSYEACFYYL